MPTNLTEDIAAKYWGCKLKIVSLPAFINYQPVDMIGIEPDQLYTSFNGAKGHFPINQCLLLLTPISAIFDNDAIEVARICFPLPFQRRKDGWIVERTSEGGWNYITVSHPKNIYSIQINDQGGNGFGIDMRNEGESILSETNIPMCEMVDFLRRSGYDCDRLIKNGCAVENQGENHERSVATDAK